MPDIKVPNPDSEYGNAPELDPVFGDDEADCNRGGMGNITRELHQTIPPSGVDRAARQAQAESDAAYRKLLREVGSEDQLPKR